MSLDADTIVDRRRMRRKLTFWRVCAIIVAIGAVVAGGAALRAPGTDVLIGRTAGSIARVTITGLIRTDLQRVEALERLGKSRARAVIVHINSPGGTTSGSEQLHDSLTRLKAQKPLVVVVDGVAASGGYITAIAADHIVAMETSLVGSIGVLFQYPNVDEIGDERAALAWLAKEKNIDPNTPVRDYRLRERFSDWPFLHTALVTSLEAVGLSSFAKRLEEWGAVQAIERLNLDGLLALWHPPIGN